MPPVRILVADDHDVVRKGLRMVLASHKGWEICGEAANGPDVVKAALSQRPDVIVMDINMPGMSGLEATREILNALPLTQVLILSAYESENLIRQMLTSGARGYVLKSDVSDDLMRAVEALCEGRLYFTSSVSGYVLNESRRGAALAEPGALERPTLTARERHVLQLLAEGKGNKEIATILDISIRTVETHRGNLMGKLDAHSLSDLVRYAVQNEIVRP
jgi:DNA-binding NarL/FixJ family response regulator